MSEETKAQELKREGWYWCSSVEEGDIYAPCYFRDDGMVLVDRQAFPSPSLDGCILDKAIMPNATRTPEKAAEVERLKRLLGVARDMLNDVQDWDSCSVDFSWKIDKLDDEALAETEDSVEKKVQGLPDSETRDLEYPVIGQTKTEESK